MLATSRETSMVLPPSYLEELESHNHDLSLAEWAKQENLANFAGFEALDVTGPRVIQDVSLLKLGNIAGSIGHTLSAQVGDALAQRWKSRQSWQQRVLKDDIIQIVAKVCVRAFAGPELAQNARWIDISTTYIENAFEAAADLRAWPPLTRPLVNRWLRRPRCLRAQLQESRRILDPVIEQRRTARLQVEAKGAVWPPPGTEVALDWIDELAAKKGAQTDPVVAQLTLAFASISQTSDLCTQVLLNLCQHPDIISLLREEATSALRQHGWGKKMLPLLLRLDSVCKETQRLHTDRRKYPHPNPAGLM
jgi:cytochrome P450